MKRYLEAAAFPPKVVLGHGVKLQQQKTNQKFACHQKSCLNPNSEDDGTKEHIWYQIKSGGWTLPKMRLVA